MVKKSLSRYAPRPWGMQPNTSLAAHLPRSPWTFHCSCLFSAYSTTFPFYTFYMFYTAKHLPCILCIRGCLGHPFGARAGPCGRFALGFLNFVSLSGSNLCVLCSSALNTTANTIGSDLVVKVTWSVFLAHAW